MTKLLVSPKIEGFAVDFGSNALRTELDGGAGRCRLDKIGAAHQVQVQWILLAQAYDYLMAFYRTEIDYGSLPFEIDLKAVDGSALGTYTARLIPGTMKMTAFLGSAYQVSATLEITPAAVSKVADQALITAGPGV